MLKQRAILFLKAILALFALVLLAWMIVAGPVTVLRILQHGTTRIDDYSKYPSRTLTASENPWVFGDDQASEGVPQRVTFNDYSNQPLDELLQNNDSIAFLVIKDGDILYERYFQGHDSQAISQVFSVSKAITSILIGAAIQDGLIESVDQPVTDFVPEMAAQGFDQVSLLQLLTMTSGSDYEENDNPFGEHVIFNYTSNLEARIMEMKVVDPPGSLWRYKSGDNALLGLILERALAPRSITEYTQEKLWTPLGMEADGLWTIDHAGDGLEKTWCCLAVSARDLAKIGQLVLDNGAWGGQQLLSPDWVAESTSPAIPYTLWPTDYRNVGLRNFGYQWWLATQSRGDYLSQGKDGQYLYINPSANMIIVRLGWSSGNLSFGDWLSLFQNIASATE